MESKNGEFTFTGIGTSWYISVDGESLDKNVQKEILDYVRIFNERFSRFLDNTEATAFRNASSGEYQISKEFSVLLARADEMRELTNGLCDPAVGELLELAGYDPKYSMVPKPDTSNFILPKWKLVGKILTIDRPAIFDIGGMGKGYLIDKVAEILEKNDFKHYLVDGGGDIFATTKHGEEPWKIALEYPGKLDTAVGVVELKNQAVAVSDSFRRRWDKWHHIVHPTLKAPIENVLGVIAVAPDAWSADSVTSALFFTDENDYSKVAEVYGASYLVFRGDGKTCVSKNWKGELFI